MCKIYSKCLLKLLMNTVSKCLSLLIKVGADSVLGNEKKGWMIKDHYAFIMHCEISDM